MVMRLIMYFNNLHIQMNKFYMLLLLNLRTN